MDLIFTIPPFYRWGNRSLEQKMSHSSGVGWRVHLICRTKKSEEPSLQIHTNWSARLSELWVCLFLRGRKWHTELETSLFFFFWAVLRVILVPRLGIEPVPLHWERGVLATGAPGNSWGCNLWATWPYVGVFLQIFSSHMVPFSES